MNLLFVFSSILLLQIRIVSGSNRAIIARLNGRVQLINLNVHTEWSDYCHYYYRSWYYYIYRHSYSGLSDTTLRKTFSVVCRSLGYQDYSSHTATGFPQPTVNKPYPTYVINCQGNESSLDDCEVTYYRQTSCNRFYNLTCQQCSSGSVRLTGGVVPHQGHVEMCTNGIWTRICDAGWTYHNSFVTCRQLNYPTTELRYYSSSQYLFNNQGFNGSNQYYECFGNESGLSNCRSSVSYTCQNALTTNYIRSIVLYCGGTHEPRCSSGGIRLHMGKDQYEGRLQMCDHGIWKAVRSNDWDYFDAEVACRQLYLYHIASTKITWKTTYYSGPQTYFGLQCTGLEQRLQECDYRTTYGYGANIYLRCQLIQTRETCNHGDVRLVEGPVPSEGRLEICLQRKWGTVCRSSWGTQESAIACEQLGFQSENGISLMASIYGDGNRPIFLSSLYCNSEQNLLECSRQRNNLGYHSCRTLESNAVALRCDASTCNHGDVRLYGGYISLEGSPQVCINGQWTRTCRANWDAIDTNTFCRQLLNNQNNIQTVTERTYLINRYYPIARISMSNVTCQSSAMSTRFLRDCSYRTNNASCSTPIVGCYYGNNCTSGTVRLTAIPASIKKVVEVCKDGVWGSITSSSWDNRDARVVCKELGQPWEKSIGVYGPRRSPFFFHGTYCSDSHRSIWNCSFSQTLTLISNSYYNVLSLSSYQAAAVICRGNHNRSNDVCESGDVRLMNPQKTPVLIQGRVEICDNGQWVGICHNGYWTSTHTRLTCQKLLGKAPKVYWANAYAESGASRSLVERIYCPYLATDMSNCSVRYSSVYSYCGSSTTITGVSCIDMTYEVKLSSLNHTHSYTIGTTGQFNCSITPNPESTVQDVTVRYYWYTSGLSRSYYSTVSSNTSISFNLGYPKFNRIMCEVRANNFVLNQGHYWIEVEDAVQVDSRNYQVINGSIDLGLIITSAIFFKNYLTKLVWYYNEYPIFTSNNTNFIGHNNTILVPANHGGEYRVRYEGFLVVSSNDLCEKALLDILQYYPAFRPASINKTRKDKVLSVSSNMNMNSWKYIQFTVEDSVSITVVVDLTKTINSYFKQFALGLYNNLNNRLYYMTINKKYWTHTFPITEGLARDAGWYKIVLFSLYSTKFTSNCNSYYNFIRSAPFSLTTIILDKTIVQLNYYENLTHSFNSTNLDYYISESNQLTCYGNVDTPQLSRLFIEKNNVALNVSDSHEVQFTTTHLLTTQQFGLFKCILVAEDITFEKTIFLRNRVRMFMELYLDSSIICLEDESFTGNLLKDFTEFLNKICFCNLTIDVFSHSKIECMNDGNGTIQLRTTLTYSNDNGIITAASIISQVSLKLSSSPRRLQIGNNTWITTINYSNSSLLEPAKTKRYASDVGVTVGAIFGGTVLATIFYGIILIFYCIWKNKSSDSKLHATPAVEESKYECDLQKVRKPKKQAATPCEYEIATEMKSKNMTTLSARSDELCEQALYESVENITLAPNIVYEGVTLSKAQRKHV